MRFKPWNRLVSNSVSASSARQLLWSVPQSALPWRLNASRPRNNRALSHGRFDAPTSSTREPSEFYFEWELAVSDQSQVRGHRVTVAGAWIQSSGYKEAPRNHSETRADQWTATRINSVLLRVAGRSLHWQQSNQHYQRALPVNPARRSGTFEPIARSGRHLKGAAKRNDTTLAKGDRRWITHRVPVHAERDDSRR